nr:ribonuclease HII [Turneriella parva]
MGVDEVGRGCLFGPVTVGAVMVTQASLAALETEAWAGQVTDSKLLSAKRREELAPKIAANLPHATAHIAVRYIDRHNINRAIQYGIYRAVQSLLRAASMHPEAVRIIADGNYRFKYPVLGMAKPMPRLDTETKADLRYFPVSAASVIAKVRRDALIARAADRFSRYDLAGNAGYGTQKHRDAIAEHGLTAFHRKSFKLKG